MCVKSEVLRGNFLGLFLYAEKNSDNFKPLKVLTKYTLIALILSEHNHLLQVVFQLLLQQVGTPQHCNDKAI